GEVGPEADPARWHGGLGPPVLAPGPGERREHLVGPTALGAHPPRTDGVRRSGGEPLHVALDQALAHAGCGAGAGRRGLGADVPRARADLRGESPDLGERVTDANG